MKNMNTYYHINLTKDSFESRLSDEIMDVIWFDTFSSEEEAKSFVHYVCLFLSNGNKDLADVFESSDLFEISERKVIDKNPLDDEWLNDWIEHPYAEVIFP